MINSIKNKFIHFGCWNNGRCNKDNGINGLSKVTKKLNYYKDIDFISIAGDNYYPEKVNKEKTFNKDNFISGFECLPKDILKYVIYGNHDVEDIFGNEKCKTLTEQLNKYSKDNDFVFFDDILTYNYNNFIILFIDTTLYTFEKDEYISNTCYKNLFNNISNDLKIIFKIKDLINYQNNKVFDIIKINDKKNIIIIGHHPIYSVKEKDNKNKYDSNNGLINLFSNNIFKNLKTYYLCADTHYYQESDIIINNNKIKQYIVGTGGAELDTPTKENNNSYHEINNIILNYKVIESKKDFGFIICEIIDDKLNVEFINTYVYIGGNKLINGGNEYDDLYKNKYIKYKNKYLKLKI